MATAEDAADIHPILLRQLNRAGIACGDDLLHDARLAKLLDTIGLTYRSHDQAQYLNSRALDIASEESQRMYDELQSSSRAAIAAERDFLTKILDTIGTGIGVVDAHGSIILTNRALRTMLRASESELARTPLRSAVTIDASTDSGASLEKFLDGHSTGSTARVFPQVTVSPAGGSSFEARVSFWPVEDNDQGARGIYTFVDLSDTAHTDTVYAFDLNRDELTGLPNRRGLIQHLGSELDVRGISILLIDLFRFGAINDLYGHAVGDGVLVEAAQRIRRSVDPDAFVARVTGDEFVVVLTRDRSETELTHLAHRVLGKISENIDAGESVHVTANVGIATTDLAESPQEVLRNAHSALNVARRISGGTVANFDAELQFAAAQEHMLENWLHDAATSHTGLDVVYQPVISLDRPVVKGFEALMRWSPGGNPVSPAVFIPIAEVSGAIFDLDDFVFEQASQFGRAVEKRFMSDFRTSVNLSAVELMRGDAAARFEALLERTQIAPHQLCVEVTETAIVTNERMATEQLGAIRSLGIQVALDDFGTGYSSLSLLRSVPLDVVKIDRRFIQDLESSRENRSIVQGVVHIAHALGYGVAAEGVETRAQYDLVREFGCDCAQGYFFGRPTSAQNALDQLALADHSVWLSNLTA